MSISKEYLLLLTLLPFLFSTTFNGEQLVRDSVFVHGVVLDDIEITASRSRLTASSRPVYSYISKEEIRSLPIKSVADIIKYMPGVDIRERGASGVQADVTIRGGTGNQIKILLNGIDITDPQTEHYTMDLPVDPMLIERIEVLDGTHYSLTAFSGVINIVTIADMSDPIQHYRIRGKVTAGQYGLIAPSFVLRVKNKNGQTKPWFLNTGLSYNTSDGYAPNTDYDIANVYVQMGKDGFDFQVGAQMKNVGANNFYSTLYPYQYDMTRMAFTTFSYDKAWVGVWHLSTNAYYRTHYDRFELFRGGRQANGDMAPSWYEPNKHWTHSIGGHVEGGWSRKLVNINVGTDVRHEIIRSSNLGHHQRFNVLYFVESGLHVRNFSITAGGNGIWNSQFGHDWSLGVNLAYHFRNTLRLYVSGNRSIRVPTFTDLYYTSPTLRADKNMRPEKGWQMVLSAQWNYHHWYSSLSAYYRWGRDIIDWVKPIHEDSLIWYSTNHTSVNTTGGEITIGVQNIAWVNKIEASYSFCDVKTRTRNMLSTYAINYLKHKFVFRFEHCIYRGWAAAWCFHWRKRYGQFETDQGIQQHKFVFLLDGSVYWHNEWLKISLDAKNMTNQTYYDFAGVEQAKLWVSGSVAFTL